jgi:simple sugar transport system ATP-binding protein
MGTVMTMDVTENLILHNIDRNDFKTFKLLDWKKLVSYAESLIKKYDIKTSGPRTPIKSLSGGNQQKLLVARELEQSPKLLLAVHPTRGVDIGAIDFIHRQIIDARNKGCAVLLISTELDEILTLSDRIGVIFKGKIKGELTREDVQLGKIALWMAGGDDAQATESISDSQKADSQRTIGS